MTAYNTGTLMADIVFLVLAAGIVAGMVLLVKAKSKPGSQPAAAPNWYPDPVDPELLRYFDGQSWTGATRSQAAPPG